MKDMYEDFYKTENILRAMIECRKRQTSGKCSSHSSECEECGLCYEQGTTGEIIGALKNALEYMYIAVSDIGD